MINIISKKKQENIYPKTKSDKYYVLLLYKHILLICCVNGISAITILFDQT